MVKAWQPILDAKNLLMASLSKSDANDHIHRDYVVIFGHLRPKSQVFSFFNHGSWDPKPLVSSHNYV